MTRASPTSLPPARSLHPARSLDHPLRRHRSPTASNAPLRHGSHKHAPLAPLATQLSEEAWYRGYSGRPYIAPMAWNQMIRTEMAAVRERAEYVPGPLFAMLADRIAHVSASSPPYGPEHAAKEIAKAEATLAALHVAVGGLECYRFEVPDYHYVEEEAGVCLLAGYCFVGDGYLVGWYDKALLIS